MSTSIGTSGGIASPTLSSSAGSAVQNAALGAAGVTPGGGTTSGTSAIGQLTGNYQTFLQMLMTQLKNQDPTSPMDANQFTTELVQFSSVEQQINTNTSLTQLIQLTQNDAMIQSTAMVGHKVLLNSTALPLQNGSGIIQFVAPASGTATISIKNASGAEVAQSQVQATSGTNTLTWSGTDASGRQLSDGVYTVAVTENDVSGAASNLPVKVEGTVTGVQASGTTLNLQVGGQPVPFSSVVSVLN